jgi:hypothetical protein
VSEFESDDDEIITHTNIPALADGRGNVDGTTSPTPKSTLPRGRG